jgi:hypothetical protein
MPAEILVGTQVPSSQSDRQVRATKVTAGFSIGGPKSGLFHVNGQVQVARELLHGSPNPLKCGGVMEKDTPIIHKSPEINLNLKPSKPPVQHPVNHNHTKDRQSTALRESTVGGHRSTNGLTDTKPPGLSRDKGDPRPQDVSWKTKQSQSMPQRLAGNVVKTLLDIHQQTMQSLTIQIGLFQSISQFKPNGFGLSLWNSPLHAVWQQGCNGVQRFPSSLGRPNAVRQAVDNDWPKLIYTLSTIMLCQAGNKPGS